MEVTVTRITIWMNPEDILLKGNEDQKTFPLCESSDTGNLQ